MVVVLWDGKEVRVYKQPHVAGIECGKHLVDGRDSDMSLLKHFFFFSEEYAVGNGSVGVCNWVVVQPNHVAFGDKMEEDGGEEGKETNDSTEGSLHGQTLDSQPCLQQNVGHDEQAGPTGAIRKQLYT